MVTTRVSFLLNQTQSVGTGVPLTDCVNTIVVSLIALGFLSEVKRCSIDTERRNWYGKGWSVLATRCFQSVSQLYTDVSSAGSCFDSLIISEFARVLSHQCT